MTTETTLVDWVVAAYDAVREEEMEFDAHVYYCLGFLCSMGGSAPDDSNDFPCLTQAGVWLQKALSLLWSAREGRRGILTHYDRQNPNSIKLERTSYQPGPRYHEFLATLKPLVAAIGFEGKRQSLACYAIARTIAAGHQDVPDQARLFLLSLDSDNCRKAVGFLETKLGPVGREACRMLQRPGHPYADILDAALNARHQKLITPRFGLD